MYRQMDQMAGAAERLSRLGKKMSRHKLESTDAEQKTRNIPECDRRQAQSARQSERKIAGSNLSRNKGMGTHKDRRSLAVGEQGA